MSEQRMAETVSATLYRLHPWKNEIQPVAVLKQTTCFVVWAEDSIGGKIERRERKEGQFFDTWQDAHAALLKRVRSEVDLAKEVLHKRRSALGQVEAMKP